MSIYQEENVARIREEEEKRREVSSKLTSTLADINGLMQQNTEKNTELRKENQNMASRLQELVHQYEERQQNIEKLLRQKDLEIKISETKLKKALMEAAEEKEIMLKDKKSLLEELQKAQMKITQHSVNELNLQKQLELFQDKYESLKGTVDELNSCMSLFKKEADKTGGRIKKLEKEGIQWQIKYKKSEVTLLNMSAENLELKGEIAKLTRKNTKLHQLAKSLTEQMKKGESKVESPEMAEDPAAETCANIRNQALNVMNSELTALQKTVDELKLKAEQIPDTENVEPKTSEEPVESSEKVESIEEKKDPESSNDDKTNGIQQKVEVTEL